jgi:hypothetical protein
MYKWWIVGCSALACIVFRGNTPIGKPMGVEPGSGAHPEESWFIESLPEAGVPQHSCSFVEFDGQGDYVWTARLQENVSYWSRRRAAEHKVSSVPMARTVRIPGLRMSWNP